ncbi:DsbA family oxidoreductase [Actinacidiphila glaucinigra]|uniref:DsbA family oxidoreductase n=1 Tax=Actinacidiphila glaucinigra TaxID=235986 RepID=UPI002DDBBB54|nr:DsbA family oxidoreductase [Actinacidiphila glaucinigra]WSD63805.1 DsbA family oxidoreductase [Actinacidiphila glaucinigra]
MQIDFWSDIVCPYCALTDNRLRLALERFEHADEVRIVHRSFQLHPDLPRAGITQRRLLETHGISASGGEQIFAPIERAARAEGLAPFHPRERTLGPTDYAHELLALATDQGRGREVWTAMFRAHFGQGRELWTMEQVLDFADEAGLDGEEAAEALRERRYQARVAADQREAERLGARGTPFITLDGAYAVHGAVGTEELLAAITRAWEAAHPEPRPLTVLGGTEAAACGPDGCEVPRRPAP